MTLRDEILARADLAGAVAARDLDAIAALVSAGRTRRKLVQIADIQARLQSSGAWWRIKAALADPTILPEAYRAGIVQAAVAVVDVANARYNNVDMSIPLVDASFGALVSVGLLPAATYNEIVGMSYEADPVSRVDVAGELYNDDGSMK